VKEIVGCVSKEQNIVVMLVLLNIGVCFTPIIGVSDMNKTSIIQQNDKLKL